MITVNLMSSDIRIRLYRKRSNERSIEHRRAYAAGPKAKAYRSTYQKEHMKAHTETNREWRVRNPEQWAILQKQCNLRRNGWTADRRDQYLIAQKGLCAICGISFDEIAMQATGMHADHEHITPPKPRGLLCGLCNKGLGQFKDDPKRLEKAAEYLRKWGK